MVSARTSRRHAPGLVERDALTVEWLRSVLHYDAETGRFTWLVKRGRKAAGDDAGGPFCSFDGPIQYWGIRVGRKFYPAHRLAWFWVHGTWPKELIDHIDGDGLNNRLSNLREATPRQNQGNRRINKNNTTGFKGVSYFGGKFVAQIKTEEGVRYIGAFDTAEKAHAAYYAAAQRSFGEFARAG